MNNLHDAIFPQEANLEGFPQACNAEKASYEESFYIPVYNDDTFACSNDAIDEDFMHFFSWPSFSSFGLELSDRIPWDPDFDNMVDLSQHST